MRRVLRVALFAAVSLVLLVALTACAKEKTAEVEPKIKPPAIQQEGVLVAGVDLSTPPFAGVDKGERAGIDIDVASALAGSLGLEVKFVDVQPSEAATALAEGKVDVVLSVPLATADLARISSAGTYLHDGPAFFQALDASGSVEPTLTLESVEADKYGAQEESEAFWILQQEFGPEMVEGYESLRAALVALDEGKVDVVGGDAIVGGYILQDFEDLHLVGQVVDAQPLAIAVSPDNESLGEALRSSLDEMAAGGVIEAIMRKWVPGLPGLRTADASQTAQ